MSRIARPKNGNIYFALKDTVTDEFVTVYDRSYGDCGLWYSESNARNSHFDGHLKDEKKYKIVKFKLVEIGDVE